MEVGIIRETDNWIALNKPSGLLSIPDREGKEVSLKSQLIEQYGEMFTIHRLDRETSGLILFAKNADAHKYFSRLFEERSVKKIYVGLVHGTLSEKEGTIDLPIGEHPSKKGMMAILKKGKPSVTDYKVLEEFGKYSLLEFNIHTGRTHQIRVHIQQLGHPIVCDDLYGDGKPVFISGLKRNFKLSKSAEEEKPILDRLGLHAARLSFTDADVQQYDLEADMPRDMKALIRQLGKWSK